MARVVDRAGPGHPDREGQAVDRRVVAHRAQGVHCVGWDVHEVALADLPGLARDRHEPTTRGDVIELVGRVVVRVHFAATRDQLKEAGIETMRPFTDLPYLRQAFTKGEQWMVDPARIERIRSAGLITDAQAEQFLSKGALGSHLEILQREEGYKGFNQHGINEIISATDPRSVNKI